MRNYYDWLREYYRGRWERDNPTVEVVGKHYFVFKIIEHLVEKINY
jgi:hypothetical protein